MSTTETKAVTGEFAWHDLLTTDVAAAKRFYGGLLGWQFEQFDGGQGEYPLIVANDARHGGIMGIEDGRPGWIGHVRVTDADEAQRRAEAAGGSAMGEPGELEGIGRWAPIADPGGASISAFAPAYETPAAGTVFAWVELMTSDPDRAKQFYAETLGWGTGEMDMGEAGTYGLFKRADGEDVAGVIRTPAGASMPDVWYPYLATDDVDGSTAKAKELGATVYVEPMDVPGVGRFSVLADPTGATFGLFAPAGG
jgi:predicted enzyme related to lactoylglutathione lyase